MTAAEQTASQSHNANYGAAILAHIALEYLRQNSVTLPDPIEFVRDFDYREIPAHVAAQAMEAR